MEKDEGPRGVHKQPSALGGAFGRVISPSYRTRMALADIPHQD